MDTISDAVRLRAPGTTITLKDGSVVTLIFDFDALVAIERDFDSLENFAEGMKGCPPNCAEAHVHQKGKRQLTTMRAGILAALSHTGRPEKELAALLDLRHLAAYMDALTEAFMQAMPEGNTDPNALGSHNGSPGNGFSILARSAMGEPPPSSGG